MSDWARLCQFCLDRNEYAVAVGAEFTTSGMQIDLCGPCIDLTCELRARLGIGFKQPLPTPGVCGSVFRRLTEAPQQHTH